MSNGNKEGDMPRMWIERTREEVEFFWLLHQGTPPVEAAYRAWLPINPSPPPSCVTEGVEATPE